MDDQPVILIEQQQGLPGFEHREGLWVTISEAARIYRVSEQSIRDWIKDDIINKPTAGQINLTEVIEDVYKHQRKIIEGRGGSSRGKIDETKAELIKLELEKRRGTLVSVSEVKKLFFDAFRQTRDAMQNIPPRVSAIFAAKDDEFEIKKILSDEIYNVLMDLSKADGKIEKEEYNEATKRNNQKNILFP